MNILMVTQWFDPEPNNMKALVFAKRLQSMGNNVEVITGFPNYPIGKICDGYKLRRYLYEEMDGIPVHRVFLYPSHDKNKWKRMLNYFSFGFSVRFFNIKKLKYRYDAVYVYHPPLTSAGAALKVAKKRKTKLLLDINDLWPESISATGMMSDGILTRTIDKWCARIYKKADRINVLSDGIKNILVGKGVPAEKISTIPVWCNEDLLTEEKDETFYYENNCKDRFTLIYAGAIGNAQNLSVFVDVAYNLRSYENIQIILIGTGTQADEIRNRIKEKNLENIRILGNVPPKRVVPILNCADALIIHLAKNDLFNITIPSKIPLYMAAKKPIIAGLEGDAEKILRAAQCGYICEPENIDELSNAIIKVYRCDEQERAEMAESGYDYHKNRLSIDSCVKKFNDCLHDLSKS